MEWIVLPGGLAVEPAIGCGDHEQPVVGENSCHFVEHLLLVLHVLDDLERHNGAEGSRRRRTRDRALYLRETRGSCAAVIELAVLDRPLVDIHADHMFGRPSEDGGAESLATS